MKILHAVVLFAILGLSLSIKLTEDMLLSPELECIKEVGIDVQTVLNNVNDDFSMTEGDPKLNEYSECWYRKVNGIDENNEIKYDHLKTVFASYMDFVNKDIADKDQAASDSIDACKNVEGNSLGDRLVKFGNCAVKYNTKK